MSVELEDREHILNMKKSGLFKHGIKLRMFQITKVQSIHMIGCKKNNSLLYWNKLIIVDLSHLARTKTLILTILKEKNLLIKTEISQTLAFLHHNNIKSRNLLRLLNPPLFQNR